LEHGNVVNPKVFAIERTAGWDFASIVTAELQDDGKVATELVGSFNKTNIDEIIGACSKLQKYGVPFIMDSATLSDLALSMKQKGLRVQTTSQKDLMNASNNAYSRIIKKKLKHPKDEIVSLQMQRAIRKNAGDSWKITRRDNSSDIDAALATVLAVWFVDTQSKPQQMVF
jgi:hypothetical protein